MSLQDSHRWSQLTQYEWCHVLSPLSKIAEFVHSLIIMLSIRVESESISSSDPILHCCVLLTLVYLAMAFCLQSHGNIPRNYTSWNSFPAAPLTLSCSSRVACHFDHVSSSICLFFFVLFPLIYIPYRTFTSFHCLSPANLQMSPISTSTVLRKAHT